SALVRASASRSKKSSCTVASGYGRMANVGDARSDAAVGWGSIAFVSLGGIAMKPSVRRVADALLAAGIEPDIFELADSTRTAQEAAAAIGTSVPCIVKSLVFLADDEPVLALVSGSNRADTTLLASALGKSIGRADAARVRDATGF